MHRLLIPAVQVAQPNVALAVVKNNPDLYSLVREQNQTIGTSTVMQSASKTSMTASMTPQSVTTNATPTTTNLTGIAVESVALMITVGVPLAAVYIMAKSVIPDKNKQR